MVGMEETMKSVKYLLDARARARACQKEAKEEERGMGKRAENAQV